MVFYPFFIIYLVGLLFWVFFFSVLGFFFLWGGVFWGGFVMAFNLFFPGADRGNKYFLFSAFSLRASFVSCVVFFCFKVYFG